MGKMNPVFRYHATEHRSSHIYIDSQCDQCTFLCCDKEKKYREKKSVFPISIRKTFSFDRRLSHFVHTLPRKHVSNSNTHCCLSLITFTIILSAPTGYCSIYVTNLTFISINIGIIRNGVLYQEEIKIGRKCMWPSNNRYIVIICIQHIFYVSTT